MGGLDDAVVDVESREPLDGCRVEVERELRVLLLVDVATRGREES